MSGSTTPGRRQAGPGVVVVTGAAMGMGRAIAQKLLDEGHAVVGLDRDEDALRRAATDLGDGFAAVAGDVGDADAHERAADAAERLGPIRGWVSNAGIDHAGAAHEETPARIDAGIRVLLLGVLYGCATAVRRMLAERGGGAIVNVSSIQGVAAFPRYYVYGAAKAGILQATRSIAVDYASAGIRANAILPGTIETPMTYSTLPPDVPRTEALALEGRLAPLDRVGQPDEVAELAAFLLSDRAAFITGTSIPIDGGATARCYAYQPIDTDT